MESSKSGGSSDGKVIPKSIMATNTVNPIRRLVDQMKLEPNPDKALIPLSIGDPTTFGNLCCSDVAVEAVVEAVKSGKYNGYAPAVGYIESRTAVAQYSACPHYPNLSASDVILTSGCSSALEYSILVLANPGDNILIPRPGFSLYKTLSDASGIHCKYYNLIPEKNWEIDIQDLESTIDERTVAVVINNPSNPCGTVYSREHLIEVLDLVQRYQLPVIADEIYSYFTFGNTKFEFLASLNSEVPILSCGGLTKRFLCPGWRMGWIVIYDLHGRFIEVRSGLADLATRTIGSNTLIQGALPKILKEIPDDYFQEALCTVKNNLSIVKQELAECPGLKLIEPSGAMYAMLAVDLDKFPDFEKNEQFISKMINEESVFCLPSEPFGIKNYFRILLTLPPEKMREACKRISDYCKRHYRP